MVFPARCTRSAISKDRHYSSRAARSTVLPYNARTFGHDLTVAMFGLDVLCNIFFGRLTGEVFVINVLIMVASLFGHPHAPSGIRRLAKPAPQ